ncbi:MAG: hypothetical protein WC011_01630 [Candidatus Paceibacterota bacterium]
MNLFKKQNLINLKRNQKDKGFVILFAVVLTSIILSVSLGLADITYKEISFGTSAKNTGEAFFASDTGIECALYYDFKGVQTSFGGYENPFGYNGAEPLTLECARNQFGFTGGYSPTGPWTFILFNLGTSGKACAVVTVTKDFNDINDPDDDETIIVSKGYNTGGDNISCTSNSPTRVEREIELRY